MAAFELDVQGHVAVMTINRPDAMNALNREVREGMDAAFDRLVNDADLRVGIIIGEGGRAFSAGADLKEMAEGAGNRGTPWTTRAPSIMSTLEIWKPLIAAIDGYCLGGGLELALSCDLRVATEASQFGLPEVSRGIIPGAGGTQRLPRAIPFGIALELLMTGKRIPAEEAARWGILNRVVPSREELMPACMELAEQIGANAPLAVQAVKESAYRGRQTTLAEGLRVENFESALLGHTEDAKEGPLAFAEKRAPNWQGR
jgi:enoyl-CoA hydratase/carnithine racemase